MTFWARRASGAGAHARIVGHRGGRGAGWPLENTIAAFERAAHEGARAIELDTRLAATGDAVLVHDPELADGRSVATLPYRELARAGIDRLDDALSWARGRGVAVNVEVKRDVPAKVPLLRRVARDVRGARADVLISSFDPLILAGMAALLPEVPRALLLHPRGGWQGAAIRRAVGGARPPAVFAVHPEASLATAEAIDAYRLRGMAVGVYTVNDAQAARALDAAGVDWIITDAPGVIGAALAG